MAFGQIVVANQQADPTLSAAVAKATSGGTDGLILTNAPLLIPKLLQAIKSSGFTGKTASITALFAPELIKASGAAANGVLLSSQLAFTTDTSNPAIVQFLADMKKYEPSSVIDESTEFSWASVMLFAKVAATAASTDAPGILAAMNALSTPINIGVTAPYSVVGKTSPVPGFTRIFNATAQFGAIENGALVPDGKGFQDPFTKA
jgi:ABC-type branched-subunit amino acid transport system substrate-binding protein